MRDKRLEFTRWALVFCLLSLICSSRAEPDAGVVECQIIRVLPDGRLRLSWGGREENAGLKGIESAPPRVDYVNIVARAATRPVKPARCTVESTKPLVVSISVYGWQDKSGDVWLDLATLLLDARAARKADKR
jgi:hypothetical protein